VTVPNSAIPPTIRAEGHQAYDASHRLALAVTDVVMVVTAHQIASPKFGAHTDRLSGARVATAIAPAHQYQPPSVTAIKPRGQRDFRTAEPKSPPPGKQPCAQAWSVFGQLGPNLGPTP
jgi:hypothetical protein